MEPSAGLEEAKTALVQRHFTDGQTDPFDTVDWEVRDAWPTTPKYHNPGIEVPVSWSQNALDITSKLYLAKADDYTEKSIRQLIQRVASKYAYEMIRHEYAGNTCWPLGYDQHTVQGRLDGIELIRKKNGADDSAIVFYDELCWILLHQMAAFNSPVWFNVGRHDRPQQVSACFILSVEDSTKSIKATSNREIDIFRGGSGSGFDVSRLRGSMEPLSTGGFASGPVSFMRLWDAGAGTFKSGGVTRRAAKLVKCDVDHPDIADFIACKPREEDRLRILAAAGINIGFDEEGERNVAEMTSFQNANNSVGVTDAFMRKATGDDPDPQWRLEPRTDMGGRHWTLNASVLMDEVAHAAWECADPGMLFMDTINRMHTTPTLDGVSALIRCSNPCGEYLSNDDTSCNLASINVAKFIRRAVPGLDAGFAIHDYQHVVDVMTFAMDVSISFADFPDPIIADRTRKLRQLGLGYSNMGAAIMAQGLAYDSLAGRDFAASVTALATGRAYRMSAIIAGLLEPFYYYDENREAMLAVIDRHFDALPSVIKETTPAAQSIWAAAMLDWSQARLKGSENGFRNAQASVLAPAGSISFLMDCDTTGVEPAFTLVAYKELAGGGSMTLINSSVVDSLRALRYYEEDIRELEQVLREDGEAEFKDALKVEHVNVFHGANEISAEGHIKMLAAVQPFVSGGISKTINLPESATVGEVRDAYEMAWRLGVKDLALYRNNSKARQVLAGKPKEKVQEILEMVASPEFASSIDLEAVEFKLDPHKLLVEHVQGQVADILDVVAPHLQATSETDYTGPERRAEVVAPVRRRLPRTRDSKTHKIHVRSALGHHEGYVSVGFFPDGTIGEMFLEGFGRLGGFTQNALSSWATDFSIARQYGVPLDVLIRKHIGHADETGGMVVPDPAGEPLIIRSCESLIDYVAKWVVAASGDVDFAEELGVMTDAVKARKSEALDGSQADVAIGPDAFAAKRIHSMEAVGMATISSANGNGHAKTVELSTKPCEECGGTMQRAGACWQCRCGNSTGCG